MTIEQIIAGELSVRPQQAAATLELLDSGNTIPFIARYRSDRIAGRRTNPYDQRTCSISA